MARCISIILALANYVLFEATGQPCSTAGTKGLTGCECNFLGACDVRGNKIPGLNILNHLPEGLELYAHVRNVRSGKNLAFLCEGNTVPILYDCNNRIPLYAAIFVNGIQLAAKPGTRPKGTYATFRESGTGLGEYYQQDKNDYLKANTREISYESTSIKYGKRKGPIIEIDPHWKKARDATSKARPGLGVGMHRGHVIASNFGIGDFARKVETFVYTNAVPQFDSFNSGCWKTFEGKLIRWGRVNCLKEGSAKSTSIKDVQMFIVVGAVPSTFPDPSNARFFGSSGFSDTQDDLRFPVNVPTWMWTASCCTFEYIKNRKRYFVTKSTAYWGENVPNSECNEIYVDTLEKKLTPTGKTRINLFPFSDKCKRKANYEKLP